MKSKEILLIIVLILVIPIVSANLECSIKTNCSVGESDILHLNKENNTHAELPNQTNYNYKICCDDSDFDIGTNCSGNYSTFLRLSHITDAHVAENNYTEYPYQACLSSNQPIECNYSASCSLLGTSYTCLASISNVRDAHIATCSYYPIKVCCQIKNTIPPAISSFGHFPQNPITQETVLIKINSSSRSGVKKIDLYVDNATNPVNTCNDVNTCNVSVAYNKSGIHYYFAKVYDIIGNMNYTLPKSFFVLGNSSLSCSNNTGNAGKICAIGEYCGIPGIFVNSRDGGVGVNEGTAQPGGAKCCTSGFCSSLYVLPKCEGPPLYGTQYDPLVASCSFNFTAEVENPAFSCCVGDLTMISGFDVYWSRQTSGYFKLTEAAEGDNLYCVAVGTGSGDFIITSPSNIKESGVADVENGIAKFSVLTDEIGTYSCNASLDGQSKIATIKVSEAGKDPTKLPYFGFVQFVIALSLIIIYQVCKVKIKSLK